MNIENKTESYKMIADTGGNCYRFFCERSGLALCTTRPIRAETRLEELRIAWKTEGRQHFNKCPHRGKWVSDLMFNVETSECVVCSPWEDAPNYCSHCSEKLQYKEE